MRKSTILSTLIAVAATCSMASIANAQPFPGNPVQPGPAPGAPVETIRTPLLDGAPSAAPFQPAPEGQPPAIGDGPTPAPVHPGQAGMPVTLLPWVPSIPANQIDRGSMVPLPITPAVQAPPGVLGPALTPFIPPPPSTPGPDPGSMQAPPGFINPADEINIIPTGGIPGTGGFYTSIPTVRRGGQESHQYSYRGRNSVIGGGGSDGSQDNIERLGPWAGWGAVTGVPTGNGWRNNSIELGGGQRFDRGGNNIISTGSTVQDYGLSSMRQNSILGLTAQQTTEFGQGMRRLPMYSHKSTDFGFPYAQFDPANVNPQKQDHLMLPTAIITNF